LRFGRTKSRLFCGLNADMPRPLVSVMIATRDRAPELRRTLELVQQQQYESLEIVVIDDGSREPVEPLVREFFPLAEVIRHEDSQGQCQRRNEGFSFSKGEFILHLDDDCCFTRPQDLDVAVAYLAERPSAGAVVFDLYNGPVLPDGLPPSDSMPGCVRSFVGAAILFRADAIRQTAGYRPFYRADGEEDELALQLLGRGWQILYCPFILAHHRLSALNRNSPGSWRRKLGNDIWTVVLHLPARRLPVEIGWKLVVAAWDAVRLLRFAAFCQGVWRCLLGLRRAWRLRSPFSPVALRRYDALRLRSVLTESEFDNPPTWSMSDFRGWWLCWHNRARNASLWEGKGDKGSSNIVRYAHEHSVTRRPRRGTARPATAAAEAPRGTRIRTALPNPSDVRRHDQ
jgi:GT2 family glycosyltransferase